MGLYVDFVAFREREKDRWGGYCQGIRRLVDIA